MALFKRREDGLLKGADFNKLWQPLRKLAKRAAHAFQLPIGQQNSNGTTSRCPVITPHNTPNFILPNKRPYNKPKRTSSQRQLAEFLYPSASSSSFCRLDRVGLHHGSWSSLEQSESPDDLDSPTDRENGNDDPEESGHPGYASWSGVRSLGRQDFDEIQTQRGAVGVGGLSDGKLSCPALDLHHLKSKTSYGFETLHTQPRTLRRESLFHDVISRSVPVLDSMQHLNKDDSDLRPDRNSVTDHRGNMRRKSLTMNDLCAASLIHNDPLYPGSEPTGARRNTTSPSLVRKVFGKVQKICLKHKLSPKSSRRALLGDSVAGTIEGSVCYLVRSSTLSLYDFSCSFSGGWRAAEENGQIYLKFDVDWMGGASGGGTQGGSGDDGGASSDGSDTDDGRLSTESRRVARRVEFDAHLGIPDVRSAQLAANTLRIRCCAPQSANRKVKVLAVVYVDLKDLLPNEERHVRETFQSQDETKTQDQLRVLSPRNAVEVGVTLDTGLDRLVITIYCLSKTRRDKISTGVYVSICLVQPARSPQNVRTTLQTHNSDQLNVESFTFEVSEYLQGMSYICAIITLMNQTGDGIDEVLGRVCLGELAVTEQEGEHWSSALSNPGMTYKRWHTFRTE